MSEKVLCPYCGAEMELTCYFVIRSRKYATRNRFVCKECDAYAPSGDSEKNAIAAALRRYTPPIKPLTLEEAYEADLCYIEYDTKGSSEPQPVLLGMMTANSQNKKCVGVLEFGEDGEYCVKVSCENYGKTWRCWKRKPTKEEMEAAAWEK